jgi:hypothetical protein
MMEEISSSETSVLTRTTRRNIREDAILHSSCRETIKVYKIVFPDYADFIEVFEDNAKNDENCVRLMNIPIEQRLKQ